MGEVKLYGNWSSLSTCRLIWALSLKHIPYQFVEEEEENLTNKTPLLLPYNPTYQKLPVLVHGGKPISETTVILEYIDETWPHNPLLPADPMERATARFWVQFIDDMGGVLWRVFGSGRKEYKKAKRESLGMLRVLEEQGIGEEEKFFGGEKIGMVDLAMGQFGVWLRVMDEVIGEKLIEESESESFPRLGAWSRAFMEAPPIRENLPDRDHLVSAFKSYRNHLQPPSFEYNLALFQCVCKSFPSFLTFEFGYFSFPLGQIL